MSIPGDDEKAATVDDEKATTVDDKKATRIPEDKPTAKKTKTQFRTVRLGIWEVFLPVRPGWNLGNVTHPSMEDLKAHLSTFMLLSRLFQDIYALAPRKFVVFILAELAKTFESSVKLYLDSRIWYAISMHLGGKQLDTSFLMRSMASRILASFLLSLFLERCKKNNNILRDRVKFFSMEKSMHTALLLDPTTAEDPDVKSKLGSPNFKYDNPLWVAFSSIIQIATGLLKSFSQMVLTFTLIRRHASAPLFFVLCVMQPIFGMMVHDGLWGKTYLALCVSEAYERLATLHRFAFSSRHRTDRVSDGAAEYVTREFKKYREIFGDASTDDAVWEWSNQSSFIKRFLDTLTYDFPIFYFSLRIILSPEGLSLSTLAVLRETAASVKWTIYLVTRESKTLARKLASVKKVYAQWDIKNHMKDGDLPYPSVDDETETKSSGMELEFRNVSFKYPGTSKAVLEDVSFKIKSGQMVVIVGVNGSGKSSTINLFNRLYDPIEGEILVDGLPLTSYKMNDVRRAMAILRQDCHPYPLSLRLNLALGCPDRGVLADEETQAALEAGGADAFVQKLPQKVDTVLNPVRLSSLHFQSGAIKEMKKMAREKEKVTGISGGESQRLAAAKTFMRLNGGGIRFVAADEPTSALDPEGELALFNHLRDLRGGKTAVIITHRFGHLTKYADLILVLKDGRLIESGSHNELVENNGEYARLYDVQAQAFLPTSKA